MPALERDGLGEGGGQAYCACDVAHCGRRSSHRCCVVLLRALVLHCDGCVVLHCALEVNNLELSRLEHLSIDCIIGAIIGAITAATTAIATTATTLKAGVASTTIDVLEPQDSGRRSGGRRTAGTTGRGSWISWPAISSIT